MKLFASNQVSYKNKTTQQQKKQIPKEKASQLSALALGLCGLNLMRRIPCHHYPEAMFRPMIKYAFESQNKNNKQKISVEARLAGGGRGKE